MAFLFTVAGQSAAAAVWFRTDASLQRQRINLHRRLELGVLDMKMRRRVVVEVHPDYDAVEKTDGGHDALKEIELIGCFIRGLSRLAVVREDALVLLVGELQDVDFTAQRQAIFHPFA